ncbi:hypothetical protein E2C01_091250 [Portunus trituberculatus]|uniref:Uncharacterized protein n=1 Tax=Portunus trituberculatus TaxID=210409 RepID=A0A5B7JNW3_PORTR|nr:hypothetical protein [Portunus trituberculatus]
MMSLPRLRENRNFSSYSSSAECANEDKTLSSALSEDVEGSARFNGLKKEDMEEGPAVGGSAHFTGLKKEDMEAGQAVAESAWHVSLV